MAERVQVNRNALGWVRGALLGVAALLLSSLPIVAQAAVGDGTQAPPSWTGSGFVNGAGSAQVTVTVPDGTTDVYCYVYDHTYDSTPTEVVHKGYSPAASGAVTFFIQSLPSGQASYVRYTDVVNGLESAYSDYMVVSPYQNVFVVNWPDTWSLSSDSITNLQNAITGLENQVGVGDIKTVGGQLTNGIGNITGLSERMGGDLAFSVPIIQSKYGNVTAELFTTQQLQQMTWLPIVRDVVKSALWMMFCLYLLNRFAPQFKA